MRVSTTIVGLVGAVAGAATAVTGYQHLAAVDHVSPSPTTALPAVGRPPQAAPPRIRIRLADCRPPARLVHRACVTTVTRTRVVYDPAPPQPASPPVVAPAPAAVAAPAPAPAVRTTTPRHRVRPAGEREHESGGQPEPGDD